MNPKRDTRSACGRRYPAPASYRWYVGSGCERVDTKVLVIWETPYSYKIKAIERTRLIGLDVWLEAEKTALVSKRSIIFLET
mgnify:CR=1 FL=1